MAEEFITVTLVGTNEVRATLANLAGGLPAKLHAAIQKQGIALQRYVKEQKLSGQVLKNRTGRLRRSINLDITDSATSVVASVGTNVVYAAAHEYGFSGQETVRAHTREITQAFGRPIAATTVHVREFTRHMTVPARSFLRSALNELRPQMIAGLRASISDAVKL